MVIIFQSPSNDKNEVPVGNRVRELCPLGSMKRLDGTIGRVNNSKLIALNAENALASVPSSSSVQEFGDKKSVALGSPIIKRSSPRDGQLADERIEEEEGGGGEGVADVDKNGDMPKLGKKSKKIKNMFKGVRQTLNNLL